MLKKMLKKLLTPILTILRLLLYLIGVIPIISLVVLFCWTFKRKDRDVLKNPSFSLIHLIYLSGIFSLWVIFGFGISKIVYFIPKIWSHYTGSVIKIPYRGNISLSISAVFTIATLYIFNGYEVLRIEKRKEEEEIEKIVKEENEKEYGQEETEEEQKDFINRLLEKYYIPYRQRAMAITLIIWLAVGCLALFYKLYIDRKYLSILFYATCLEIMVEFIYFMTYIYKDDVKIIDIISNYKNQSEDEEEDN